MIYMPVGNLFNAFVKGREMAIDRNWNDLMQGGNVESQWLRNDAQQLKNWLAQDTYGDTLTKSRAGASTAADTATLSGMEVETSSAAQPGRVATAAAQSEFQQALAGATRPNIPTMTGNIATAQLGEAANRGAQGAALLQTGPALQEQLLTNQLSAAQQQQRNMQAQQDLFPLQMDLTRANIEAQQRLLAQPLTVQGSGATAAPNVSMAAPSLAVDPVKINNVAGRLAPGQVTVIDGVAVSRDDRGLFIISNGQKAYIPPNPATPSSNSLFSWGAQ